MQKAVQSSEGTKRQYCEAGIAQRDNTEVLRKCFSLPESMGSKKQTWGVSDLEPKLIANQI